LLRSILQRGAAARALLASKPTSDRDLEDRSKYIVNPMLESAYKRLEVSVLYSAATSECT
jgi:hypothetical protein